MAERPAEQGQREHRRFERFRGRLACSFEEGGSVHRGFITDVSAGGFFVQIRTSFAFGTKLVVRIERPDEPELVVTGSVARMRKSHRSATNLGKSGFGLALDSAPETYFQLVMELLDAAS